MFGILSSSFRVATRTEDWGQSGFPAHGSGLPAHWCQKDCDLTDRRHGATRDWLDRVRLTGF